MSSEASPGPNRNGNPPPAVLYDARERITTITYTRPPGAEPGPPPVEIQYDRKRRRLRIAGQDGQTAEFADRPTRYLLMAPDPKTKELRPVMMGGEPVIYCLCPEIASAEQ
jgi:hypothetical protein